MSPSLSRAAGEGPAWINEVVFDTAGLVPVIAQDAASGRILLGHPKTREAMRAGDRKAARDEVAAQLILQSWFDAPLADDPRGAA